VTAPPGWTSYENPVTGWSVAYPATWRRVPGAGSPENSDFVDPRTNARLRVSALDVDRAKTSVIVNWLRQEQALKREAKDYQRIRMEPGDGADGSTQADWEFTHTVKGKTVHVLSRGAVRNGHGYILYWHTLDTRWKADTPLMWRLFSTFRPGP
jgi:hypothetical protein